ncbi:MAG TPA: hypothetical protein VKE51_31065 [Vicinamibacterales bacterium]|nr:hypothetical protein [Vicinamibacterales bacterium]
MESRLAWTVALGAVIGSSCAPNYTVPVDREIYSAVDTSPFQRVFVAGFFAGGSHSIDTNVETVRLLRSQLRSRSHLHVIESDPIEVSDPEAASDVAYWREIGEELQEPLIVTGSAVFKPVSRSRSSLQVAELSAPSLRRRELPTRIYIQQSGYQLRLTVALIDGRSGVMMRSDTMQEEVLYGSEQQVPALSGYFDLMNRILPNFLATLVDHRVEGTRVLLK